MPATEITFVRPELYPAQFDAIYAPQRYAITEASTKAGKTSACLVWIVEQAMRGKGGQNFWWIAPVYSQTKIAFRRLRRGLTPGIYRANESELYVELANGTIIWFKSAEKPDNLYGEDVYAAVVDEATRVREESWHALRSTLTATRGPVRIIGNVKGTANWAFELAREAELGEDPDLHYAKLTWRDAVEAGVLDEAEIEDARRHLPEPVFRELYEAEPADLEGRVYYGYSVENVADVTDTGGDLFVGMDFNVDPMSAVLAVKAADELHALDEIEIRNSGTEEMAREIEARIASADWVARSEDRKVVVCPDPSGSARKTSAPVGQTDFTILKDHGFEVRSPRMAPPVADRVNEVNAMLCAADGRRRLLIHPRCRNLQRALDYLVYKEGASQPDKSKGFDHLTDALGYLVHSEFPINRAETLRVLRADFMR